ncbi:MAG: hypothetical protein ACREL5_00825 [Gemmatimonadales bacterium]
MRPGPAGARCVWGAAAVLAAACVPPSDDVLALSGATVVDVVRGRSIEGAVVLIRDRHIVAVGPAAEVAIPADAVGRLPAGSASGRPTRRRAE